MKAIFARKRPPMTRERLNSRIAIQCAKESSQSARIPTNANQHSFPRAQPPCEDELPTTPKKERRSSAYTAPESAH